MNQALIHTANQNWEAFLNTLSDEEKKGLADMTEPIGSNNIYFYVAINDSLRFDQTVNRLSNRYLYDIEIIQTIYNFYIDRNLHEQAFDYIKKAEDYLNKFGTATPQTIQDIIDNSETNHLLNSLKSSLEKIRNIKPKNLALITPEIVNDKRLLSEFILHEIIQASKVFKDKIHGIKKNPDEDRYNDLLLATLRLRFQVWGWSFHDQSRLGSSPTGKNPGEADFTIQAGNIVFALLEALIQPGRDTKAHIIKSFGYVVYLERYYMIVYFKGAAKDFDSVWVKYLSDVSTCTYPSGFEFDNTHQFKDLLPMFDDVGDFRIAKSMHGSRHVEMFHIMINLGE